MQGCNWVVVCKSECQLIFGHELVLCRAKHAVVGTHAQTLANSAEISVVASPLVGITFIAERLKICRIIRAAVKSGMDVIDFQSSLICRDAAQLATEARSA